MEAGNTFRYGRSSHLWVVVSDPIVDPEHVVLVNMTSNRGGDQSCMLSVGDHPFVQHSTRMRYDMARIVTNAELERHIASNVIRLQEPVSGDVLVSIREGAATTQYLPFGCRQVLTDQGLIEP